MKAQFWAFDVIFSIVIFAVAITVLAYTWYSVNTQLSLSLGNGATIADIQDQDLAQQLMSPGVPADWQSEVNVSNNSTWANVSVGLLQTAGTGNLAMGKIYALEAMASKNYPASKLPLGVGYDYYILVAGSSINLSIGENPYTNNGLSVYVQKRSGFVNGLPVSMDIMIWTKKTLAVS